MIQRNWTTTLRITILLPRPWSLFPTIISDGCLRLNSGFFPFHINTGLFSQKKGFRFRFRMKQVIDFRWTFLKKYFPILNKKKSCSFYSYSYIWRDSFFGFRVCNWFFGRFREQVWYLWETWQGFNSLLERRMFVTIIHLKLSKSRTAVNIWMRKA